jgi:mRNA interferase RelE/StbE
VPGTTTPTRGLALSEVRARPSEIAEEVATTHERVQITKNGREYVVLAAAGLEWIEPPSSCWTTLTPRTAYEQPESMSQRPRCSMNERCETSFPAPSPVVTVRFRAVVAKSAARRLVERLPEGVGATCIEFVFGRRADEPHRVGAPLGNLCKGQWRGRLGEYWVRDRIDDETRTVSVLDIEHRRVAFRSGERPLLHPRHRGTQSASSGGVPSLAA